SLDFIEQMDLLLAISQSAKDDAVKFLGIPEEKIAVIYAGVGSEFNKLKEVNIKKLTLKYNIDTSFILFAGGIDFKKNIEDLIVAYSKLEKKIRNAYQLVIVGKTDEDVKEKYYTIAAEHGVSGRVVCTGFVPDQDLIELYNVASLLVFPSLYEGFGLPVLEAMACGTRVVTSNSSSLKEIAEGHARLVNPKSVKSISEGINWVFNHPSESLKMADESIEYAKSYTWKRTATLSYNAIVNSFCKKDKINRTVLIGEDEVRSIAKLYKKYSLEFDVHTRENIANQILALNNKEDIFLFNTSNRILFDVTVVSEWMRGNYSTGIGRVCKELYRELQKRVQVIPVVVSDSDKGLKCDRISFKTLEIVEESIEFEQGDVYFMPEFQLRGIQVPKNHPTALEFKKRGIRCYAVIYDILPLQFPEYFEGKTSKAFGPYLQEILDNYDGILSDSRSVNDDIIRYCEDNHIELKENIKLGFFHLGADTFESKKGSVSKKIIDFILKDGKNYLMVGTVEPRKGHKLVLEAFEKLWKDGFDGKLCICGHVGWNMNSFLDELKANPLYDEKLVFFEAVTDAELQYCYEQSDCLIQASAGEGFGLPLIEASYYNIPVICSDIPVFHEVADTYPTYFMRNSYDLYRVIKEFDSSDRTQEIKTVSTISWAEAADKVYSM
ncbi:MAG: glycosyltransferase family 4 protein, partial [Pseudobutyrivibrio sp.]|nr:glycosyltransferase family 4 protein [Pseudobutyrivibrio sp.]